MHSRSLVVVVSALLAVGSVLAWSLVGCTALDGDAPSGSEERARKAVELGLLHVSHGKSPRLSFCQDECIAASVYGCAEVCRDCDADDSDGHIVACGYVVACDKARELACGGSPYVKKCMEDCPYSF